MNEATTDRKKKMKKKRVILGLALSSLLLLSLTSCGRKSEEVSSEWKLKEEEIEEAINFGKKNKGQLFIDFQREWSVDLGYDKGSAVVYTPFYRVALLSYNSAREKSSLPYSLVNKVNIESARHLSFMVSLRSMDEEKLKGYSQFYIKCGGKIIKPESSYVHPVIGTGRDYLCVNEVNLKFLAKDISRKGKIVLVAKNKEELDFRFDLSKVH